MSTVVMQRFMDVSGAALSGLCLIHCLALPLLGALLPFAGMLAEDERVHWVIIAIAIPTALLAFSARIATRRNGWRLAALAATGIALMAGALFAPSSAEVVLAVAGGAALASAHVLNLMTARGHAHARRIG